MRGRKRIIRIKTHAEMTEVHDLTFGEPSDEGVGTEASRFSVVEEEMATHSSILA